MTALNRLAAGAGLTAALLAGYSAPAAAEASVRFGFGSAYAGSGHERAHRIRRHAPTGQRHAGRQQFGSGSHRYGGTRHRFQSRPPARGYGHRAKPYGGQPRKGRPHGDYGGGHRGYGSRYGHSPTRRHDAWSRYPFANSHRAGPKRRSFLGGGTVGSGCGPISQRYYDRYGRSHIIKRTVCHDRYGNPYVVGDGYR